MRYYTWISEIRVFNSDDINHFVSGDINWNLIYYWFLVNWINFCGIQPINFALTCLQSKLFTILSIIFWFLSRINYLIKISIKTGSLLHFFLLKTSHSMDWDIIFNFIIMHFFDSCLIFFRINITEFIFINSFWFLASGRFT